MKKILAVVLCLAIALTLSVVMMITAYAGNDPIIFDLTVENPVMGGTKGFLAQVWSGNNVGTSGYDAQEKAWKFENTVAIDSWSGGYEEFDFPEAIDYKTYKYCAVSYKTVNMASEQGERKVGFHGDGGGQVGDHAIRAISEGKYTKVIFNTEESFKDIVNTKFIISMQTWDSCELAPGAQLFVKYIAFFATKEEAKVFELNGEPDELDEPEESEPEESESRDCIVLSPAAADIGIGWEGTGATEEVKGVFVGYSAELVEYDEETYSVKFIGGGTAGVPGKMNIRFWAINDGTYNVKFNDYPYMAICFKTENAREDLGFQPGDEINSTCGQVNNFIKMIGMTPDDKTIDQATGKALTMICGDESYGVKDVVLYVQYIAFFKTKADAKAFDYYEWLGVKPKVRAETPLTYAFTLPSVCERIQLCDTGALGATSLATGSYDKAENALKIVFNQEMEAGKGLYLEQTSVQMGNKEFGLVGFYYKASGFGNKIKLCVMYDDFAIFGEPKTNINTDEYIWVTWSLENFPDEKITPLIYAEGGAIPAGAEFCLKAVGFFPDQASLDAFDVETIEQKNHPEKFEPEVSEPEGPDPEPGSIEPIIFDLTVENPIMGGTKGYLRKAWSGNYVGTSGYDADEKAWKLENVKDIEGNSYGAYEEFKFPEAIDFKTYKYCAIVYKTNNLATDTGAGIISIHNTEAKFIINDNIAPNESGEYINTVVAITDSEITSEIRVAMSQLGSTIKQGCQVFIKYIAFFANKEEAEAYKFDLRTEPEASEPEVSEPETSKPEASEPEVSKLETSKPETSKPETSQPEVSEPETSKPEASEPEVSELETSKPEVSEPEVSEPETSKTEVSEPEVSKPETSESEVSEPEISGPEVSEPEKVVYIIQKDVEIIDDEGVFEEGTTVIIEKVESGDDYDKAVVAIADDTAKVVVFEISAVKDNAAVQPNGKLKISFAIPEGFNTGNVKMFYISDTGEKVEIPVTVDKENGVAVAELEHFSTYILVSAEKQEVDMGNIVMISGAVLLICAAAATVVVFGRKRSK